MVNLLIHHLQANHLVVIRIQSQAADQVQAEVVLGNLLLRHNLTNGGKYEPIIRSDGKLHNA